MAVNVIVNLTYDLDDLGSKLKEICVSESANMNVYDSEIKLLKFGKRWNKYQNQLCTVTENRNLLLKGSKILVKDRVIKVYHWDVVYWNI